jgi:hypothetical protein
MASSETVYSIGGKPEAFTMTECGILKALGGMAVIVGHYEIVSLSYSSVPVIYRERQL